VLDKIEPSAGKLLQCLALMSRFGASVISDGFGV
jgi:hypothetical protein